MKYMYQKVQTLGGRTSETIRTYGIEDNQGKTVINRRRALRIWEKYLIYQICMIRKIAQNILQLKQKTN